MKTKSVRILSLLICLAMLLCSFPALAALAEDSSAASGSADTSSKAENIWDKKRPAYTSTQFTTIRDRLAGDAGDIDPMGLFAVNDGYAFYTDQLTGEVVILKLKNPELTKADILESGSVPEYSAFYCTNPYTIGTAKSVGNTTDSAVSEKEKLYAQIFIRYSENDKDKEMNSFVDCAVNNQIAFKNIRGGIRVEYTIGREEVVYLVPRMIRVEKLEALRDQISENSLNERDARQFMAYYMKKDLSDTTLSEKSRKEVEAQYPITKQFAIYICEPVMSAQELLRLERFVRNYTTYDYDQLEADHAETEYTSSDDVPPLFKLALEYRVEDEEIVIRCNAGNIRFDSSTYKLSDVLILPYGGAGDVNNSGFLFSPDGSGSLLDFKDLTDAFTNSTSLYGPDFAYHTVTGANTEIARLPAFGVYQKVEKDSTREEQQPKIDPDTGEMVLDDNGEPVMETVKVDVALEIAYLAVIEAGDSLAKVNVTYGGALHNFASIYTSFNPRPKDSYILDGGISAGTDAMWTVESKRKYTGDFKLRLFILDGTEDGDELDSAGNAEKGYSDMAAAYRRYLIRIGELKENPYVSEDIPLYLETLGSIPASKKVLGIPVTTYLPLTSFEDDVTILKELKEAGIGNINLKLSGWYNKGMIPEVPTSIKIEKALGGEDGFKDLLAYTKENGMVLFPDIELAYAYRDAWFDGFDSDDLAKTIDDRNALKREYDPVWQGYITSGSGVISPYFMKSLYASANKDYSKLDVGAISVCTLGDSLSSDFNSDNPITREDSKALITQLLQTISENNSRVLVSGGNNYSIKYATDIVNIPLEDSRYVYSYASVPFMSMVLHGSKNYAGTPLNLAGDYTAQILKSVESGASPYFVVATQNTSELKNWSSYSAIKQYFSIRYNIWKDDIIAAYKTINGALKDVQNSAIRKHEILTSDGNVVRVTYTNGITFVINYDIKPYEYTDGEITVPAESFIKYSADGKVEMTWEGANE